MRRFLQLFAGGFLLVWMHACSSDNLSSPIEYDLQQALNSASPTGYYTGYIMPDGTDLSEIPQDPKNPLTREKVELGKMLFFETGLALEPFHDENKETYSCSSCHVPEMGFMPGRAQGIADGGMGFGHFGDNRWMDPNYIEDEIDVQGARALNLMNVAYTTNTSWSGMFGGNDANIGTEHVWDNNHATEVNHLGYFGLESQNIEGLALHRLIVNKEVTDELGYTPLFDAAFPDFEADERYSELTGSLAISAYLRSMITNEAPFQDWLKGEKEAMTNAQKSGALLFFGKAGCYRCHNGPALNNANEFYALGVNDLYQSGLALATDENDIRNFGRGGFTGKAEDMHKFKVPQLYNMRETPFYFHGSSKRSMMEVIDYFNDGVAENPNVPVENLAPQLHPLNLTHQEKIDLIDFLENALWDPNYERFVPEFVLSGNCFPNNDPVSRQDSGCE